MIAIADVSWAYKAAGSATLHDIDLRVAPGEVVVLCGASGSGKSTLLRTMNGLVPHFHDGSLAGSITVAGLDIASSSLDEIGGRTGTVLQHPRRQFFASTVVDELSFALENFGTDPARIQARADAMMDRFGLSEMADRSLLSLSGGQQQRVAVASALGHEPGVLLLDEPSSNLSTEVIADLAAILTELRERGIGIVVSEHRLHYLTSLADRFVLLENGRVSHDWDTEAFSTLPQSVLAEHGLRGSIPPTPVVLPHAEATGSSITNDTTNATLGQKGVRLEDVHCTIKGTRVLEIASAQFPAGQVTAICGPNGAGKTALTRIIAGLQPSTGIVNLDGKRLNRRERLARTAVVMQDVQRQLFTDSARAEITLAATGAGRPAPTAEEVDRLLDEFDLLRFAEQHPLALSGGQQQRLVIAATRLARAKIVIYDEPSSGVDRRHLDSIAAAIRHSAADGAVVLLVTHDEELLHRAADARLDLNPLN